MMRVFWEEWRSARRSSVRRFLPVLALAEVVGLAVSRFQPGVYFEVLALGLVFGGVWSGCQQWNQVASWNWVQREGVPAPAYVAGKVAGYLVAASAWCLAFAPPTVLLVAVWGLPWPLVAWLTVWALAAGLGAQALGQLVTWGPGEVSRVAGLVLAGLWLLGTLQAKELSSWNPLWQLWRLHRETGADPGLGSLGLVLAATALVWVPAAWLQTTRGRKAP